MAQDFDELIDREGTNSYKYLLRQKMFGTAEVYPMWVADTEYRAPSFILEAMQKRMDHGIFGYTLLDDDYYRAIISWVEVQHRYRIKKEWIKYSPGVVPSVFASVLAFTEVSDKVIIQPPVYHPFYSAVKETGRQLVLNPLKLVDGRYQMDFDDLKAKIDRQTKLIILCSPHNPTGNVWREAELRELCEICLKNGIIIISDEIHADIVYQGQRHLPTASLSEAIAQQTLALMAPSKTFNIAGLNSSYAFSSNPQLLQKFSHYFEGMHLGPNIFAIEATKAAYFYGEDWLKGLVDYYTGTIEMVRSMINDKLKNITLVSPEATFLLWLDFRKTGLSRKEINQVLIHEAHLGFSDGFMFGPEGEGFWRMNIGCARSKVEEALLKLSKIDKFTR